MKKQEARRPGSLVLCPLGKHKYIHFTYLPRCYHCGVPYVVGFLSCSFLFLPNIAYSSWLANCLLIVGSSEKVDNLWSNPEYEDTSRMLTSPPSISASELFFPSYYQIIYWAPTGCEYYATHWRFSGKRDMASLQKWLRACGEQVDPCW